MGKNQLSTQRFEGFIYLMPYEQPLRPRYEPRSYLSPRKKGTNQHTYLEIISLKKRRIATFTSGPTRPGF